MALSMNDFRNPYFIRYNEGHTLTRDTHDRYIDYASEDMKRHFRGTTPQPGYNANNPTTVLPRVRLDVDAVSLRTR